MSLSDASCPFCAIIAEDAPSTVIYEAETVVCILDAYPVSDGHALLLPREHIEHVGDLDGATLGPALIDAVEAVRRRSDADGVNVGLNLGAAAGQTIAHLHWHIIPRTAGDVTDPTGGVRGVIPDRRVPEG
jgi:histidine triad (HIT) family protein